MTFAWVCRFSSILALGAATTASAATAPVRCHPADSSVARLICASPEYVAMDREIAALTDRGMAQFSKDERRQLAQSELRYFHQRQGCTWASHNSAHPGTAMDECLRASMEGRVRALRIMVDRGHF